MKYFLKLLLVIYLGLFAIWLSIPAHAQESATTPNLINPLNWTGQQITGQYGGSNLRDHVFGCCTGGPGAAVDTTNGSLIWFSWGPATVAQTIAINQALSGTGIKITGFNYSYNWYNYGWNSGSLTASVTMTNNAGNTIESYQWSHAPSDSDGWKTNSGTQTFNNPYSLPNLGNITMSFSGQDNKFWAGFYGPSIHNPSLSLNYGVDTCVVNPLSSANCPGYATAYLNQQCSISSLYNPACPGYQQAYFTQQCTANPLYDAACPGYQEAYFNYQCQQNGLYSSSCSNYAEAYAKKQVLSTTTDSTASTVKTDPVSVATASTTTSTTSPTSVTSVTSVISSPSPVTTTVITSTASSTSTAAATTTTEAKKTDNEVKSATSGSGAGSAKSRAEARAKEVAKAASEAATFEAQTAAQGLVVGLMGFVPGFDAYGQARIIDVNGAQLIRQYGRPVVDNRSVMRQLSGASDRLHQEMVDQQYR